MTHRHILASIQRLAAQTARRTARLAQQSQFTAEEILSDVATEARTLLMRKKWENMGPPERKPQTQNTPPHPAKYRTKEGHHP
jgi:hypothetical protein